MAALRKKIAQRRAEASPAETPVEEPPSPSVAQPATSSDPKLKTGFLDGKPLYPDGSTEAAAPLWRKGGSTRAELKVESTADAYVVTGDFRAAGRYLGKEDFLVDRQGLTLRIRGNDAEKDSYAIARSRCVLFDARLSCTPHVPRVHSRVRRLVSGLDETVSLPPDAAADGMTADFSDATLRITIPRLREGPLADLVANLTLAEAQTAGRDFEAQLARLERANEEGGNKVKEGDAQAGAQEQAQADAEPQVDQGQAAVGVADAQP